MTHPEDARSVDVDQIRLSLPALFAYGRVARLAVTGLASRNGYSYDDVEDLRIAIGEVFGVLVAEERAGDVLRLTCTLRPDSLAVDAETVPARAVANLTELSQQILAAVVDGADIDVTSGRIGIVKGLSTEA